MFSNTEADTGVVFTVWTVCFHDQKSSSDLTRPLQRPTDVMTKCAQNLLYRRAIIICYRVQTY